jgi:hypothetical protein
MIDGGDLTITHRHPRQSEVLDLLAHLAGDTSAQAQYAASLDWIARLTTAIDGDTEAAKRAADILDERVGFRDTIGAVNAIVDARLPAPATVGNSAPGAAS